MKTPLRVVVVYHYYAHYRAALLRSLSIFPGIDFNLVSGMETEAPSLEIIAPVGMKSNENSMCGCNWRRVRNIWLGGRFLWQIGILKAMRDLNPEVVITLGAVHYPASWLLLFYCKVRRLPIVFWTHGLYGSESWLVRKLRLIFYRMADHVMTYGEYSRLLLLEGGLAGDRVTAIHNSLDCERQRECASNVERIDRAVLCARFRVNPESKVVLFVGRLTRQKQLDLLIEAFAIVCRRREGHGEVQLLIVGDGPKRNELERLSVTRGICEYVRFLGAVHDETVLAGIFRISDVCVSPGEIGLTAIHSLGYGVPVVTHGNLTEQMPEVEAIDDGVTGSFFKQGDVNDLAFEIDRWIDIEPEAVEICRARCRAVVEEKWSPHFQARAIANICKSTVLKGAK